MDPEERRQYNLYHKLWMRKFRANMTPDEFKIYRTKQTELGKSYGPTTTKVYRDALRDEVYRAYGGECACCGEDYPEFLTLDHIVPVRRSSTKVRTMTYSLHLKLKRENFPKENIQLLCYNCNQAKGTKAECPHKRLCMERSPQFRLLSGGRTA